MTTLKNILKSLNCKVMGVRSNIRKTDKEIEKMKKFDISKFIKGGRVDMEVDSDRSTIAEIDELIQIDNSMASEALARLERFTGMSVEGLRLEDKKDITEQQWEACKTLFRLEHEAKNKEVKAGYKANRQLILDAIEEDNKELDILLAQAGMDDRNEDEKTYDALTSIFYKTQNKRGYDLVMWLKENAGTLTRNQLVEWSKRLNTRRFSKDGNRLSYDLWVAGKLVIEKQMSVKGITTKEKARASVEFAKRLKEWTDNNLGERFVKHNEIPAQDWQMDVENPLCGKATFTYRKMEEFIDIKRVFEDSHVAMGFILSNEDEYEIKDKTDRLSDILLSFIRSEGNKAAAAVMCGLPRSTYRNRLNKALKVVNDRLDEGKISKEEHQLVANLL